jgi:hypothetical protein
MLSQETELNFKVGRYADSLPVEVCVTFAAADSNKRPFLEGTITSPSAQIYDRLNNPATSMRCYCHSDMPLQQQQETIASIEPGTTIRVLAQQPSTKYDNKAFGTLISSFNTFKSENKKLQLLTTGPAQKQTFTVSNMPADLVERMDAKLNDIDVKRTYFLKKLINKFLAGDFDDDFV